MKARVIAFYLPQFHTIPENDIWYGKGFTEWTNVKNATPLFKGHYQPIVPHEDLGYYDLNDLNVTKKQVEIAKKYGVEAFCYWHTWFGHGKQLLEMPFQKILSDKSIDFSFCLGWANHSWEKKLWKSTSDNQIIMKQEYLGYEDNKNHFFKMLPAFKDSRYLQVDGKPFFLILDALAHDSIKEFIKLWRKLAKDNGLNGFYFVAKDNDLRNQEKILNLGIDAIYNENTLNIHHYQSLIKKIYYHVKRKYFKKPTIFNYSEAIGYMIDLKANTKHVIPAVAPNWDHSPRSGNYAMILKDSTPILFAKAFKSALEFVQKKPKSHRIILIKSWNEWAEGNYLEPDKRYGYSYLEAMKKELDGDNK